MRPIPVLAFAAALCSSPVLATDTGIPVDVDALARGSAPGRYDLRVTGDIDDDGVQDQRILSVQCDGSRLQRAVAWNVKSPRDAASGMASGKRVSGTADGSTNQWPLLTDRARALLPRLRIASIAGAVQGPSPVVLSEPAAVCPALQQAATALINTSRSNIRNN